MAETEIQMRDLPLLKPQGAGIGSASTVAASGSNNAKVASEVADDERKSLGSSPKNPTPLVSVIVPTYREARLERCLRALTAQDYPHYEVIVVNNDPSDPLKKTRRRFSTVQFLEESARGSYAARNTGIEHAKGEVIAFTDADCIPDPDWLKNGVSALLERKKCGLVAGRIDTVPMEESSPTLAEVYDSVLAFPQEDYAKKGFSAGGNTFTFRSLLRDLDSFNQDLYSGGDADLGKRIVASGHVVEYAEDAIVKHPARSYLSLFRKSRRIIIGNRHLHKIWGWSLWERTYYLMRYLAPPVERWRTLWKQSTENAMKRLGLCALAVVHQHYKAWTYILGRDSRISDRD
jgi:glycosyltransferase involved in cell wall biosynthesis